MDTMPRVSIIILNWNGWEDTIECLESVYQITYPNYDVIVVDNGSKDDSLQKIRAYTRGEIVPESPFYSYCRENKPIELIEYAANEIARDGGKKINYSQKIKSKSLILIKNGKNSGFAGGNNIAIQYALKSLNTDYYLLLNNDTVVHPDFLSELVQGVIQEKVVAITGPKCYYYDYNGRKDVIWFAGGVLDFWRYPAYRSIGTGETDQQGDYNKVMDCDWITGAAIMVSKFVPIKYLDERFFFGCEDVDLCIKTKMRGYQIKVNLNAMIWHKGGISRKKTYSNKIQAVFRGYKENMKLLAISNPKNIVWIPIQTIYFILAIAHSLVKGIRVRLNGNVR